MLGSDSFAFETPNVIDPGDLPPSQPARKTGAETEGQAPSPTSAARTSSAVYRRDRVKKLLEDDDEEDAKFATNNSSSSYNPYNVAPAAKDEESQGFLRQANDSDEKKQEDFGDSSSSRRYYDDPSNHSLSDSVYDDQHSLPAIEEARTYAVSLLHSANKTRSGGNSSQDPFARTIAGSSNSRRALSPGAPSSSAFSIDRNGSSNRRSKHLVRREVLLIVAKACGFVLLLVLFILMLVLIVKTAKAKRADDNNPAILIPDDGPTPLSRLEQTFNFLHQALLTNPDDLMTPGRPQYLAANWMAHMDVLAMDVPTSLNSTAAAAFVQRFVLATLYYATDGTEGWTNKAGFLSDQLECGWYDPDGPAPPQLDAFDTEDANKNYALGVTCNTQLQVVNLWLPSNGLKGSLPPELGHLTALTLLSMPHNQLQGPLPDTFVNLVNLNYLDLKFNQMTGRLPNIFESVNELQVLGLSNNFFTLALPPSLASLTKLQTLAIDDNQFSGSLSNTANALTALQYLYADRNAFAEDLDGNFLKNLAVLRELDLSGNGFTTVTSPNGGATFFPPHLLQHPTLQILDVAANDLTAVLPPGLDENHVLEFLSLRDNKLTGLVDVSSLPRLVQLRHLDISGNRLQGQLPNDMTKLSQLSFLFMGHNPEFSPGPIPSWLFELKATLRELSMTDLQLTNEVPYWFEAFAELRFLDLSDNGLFGQVPRQVFDLPKLSYLLLHNNTLTGPIPQQIVGADALQMLTLHDNDFFGDVNHLCVEAPALQLLAVDCSATVVCDVTCCPTCCDRDATAGANAFCFSDAVPSYLELFEGLWELNYTRATQAFDPALITDRPPPKDDSSTVAPTQAPI